MRTRIIPVWSSASARNDAVIFVEYELLRTVQSSAVDPWTKRHTGRRLAPACTDASIGVFLEPVNAFHVFAINVRTETINAFFRTFARFNAAIVVRRCNQCVRTIQECTREYGTTLRYADPAGINSL